jgi:hypothetical protein
MRRLCGCYDFCRLLYRRYISHGLSSKQISSIKSIRIANFTCRILCEHSNHTHIYTACYKHPTPLFYCKLCPGNPHSAFLYVCIDCRMYFCIHHFLRHSLYKSYAEAKRLTTTAQLITWQSTKRLKFGPIQQFHKIPCN